MADVYVIRADGNSKIGAGHMMRCLTIADQMREMNGLKGEIVFACADEDSAQVVQKGEYKVKILGTDYSSMEDEIPMFEKWFSEISQDGNTVKAILVDSYYVTDYYLQALGKYAAVILMDDMCEKAYYADGIINYNLYADKKRYEELYSGRNVKLFLGAEFIPLRHQFQEADGALRKEVKNVLITTGGADEDNIGGCILKELATMEGTDLSVHFMIVAGKYHPAIKELKAFQKEHENVSVLCDVEDMAAVMKKCDLCITAAGTTLYEVTSLGIPMICFSYAKNQEQLAEYIGKNNIAPYAGKWHENAALTFSEIIAAYNRMYMDKSLRDLCSKEERKLIDGKGAFRIAEKLLNFKKN